MATVEFSEEARLCSSKPTNDGQRWVDEHGFLTANPLIHQVEHATKLLADEPRLGKLYRRAQGHQPELRRLLLPTGWHLYYSIDAEPSRVQILAVWFASRGRSPAL